MTRIKRTSKRHSTLLDATQHEPYPACKQFSSPVQRGRWLHEVETEGVYLPEKISLGNGNKTSQQIFALLHAAMYRALAIFAALRFAFNSLRLRVSGLCFLPACIRRQTAKLREDYSPEKYFRRRRQNNSPTNLRVPLWSLTSGIATDYNLRRNTL